MAQWPPPSTQPRKFSSSPRRWRGSQKSIVVLLAFMERSLLTSRLVSDVAVAGECSVCQRIFEPPLGFDSPEAVARANRRLTQQFEQHVCFLTKLRRKRPPPLSSAPARLSEPSRRKA